MSTSATVFTDQLHTVHTILDAVDAQLATHDAVKLEPLLDEINRLCQSAQTLADQERQDAYAAMQEVLARVDVLVHTFTEHTQALQRELLTTASSKTAAQAYTNAKKTDV